MFGIVCDLRCLVEHVVVYTGCNIEKIELVCLVQAKVFFNLSSRLVWLLFYTDVVLESSSLIVCDAAFKVEDVSLNCTERVVVAHIKACCSGWLSCLGSLLDNLNPLRWNKVILKPAVWSLFRFYFLSSHGLSFVEIVFGSLFLFVDWRTRVVELRNFLHWLSFIEVVIQRR